MSKSRLHDGEPWTTVHVAKLRDFAEEHMATKKIAQALQRTVGAIYAKAHREKIHLGEE